MWINYFLNFKQMFDFDYQLQKIIRLKVQMIFKIKHYFNQVYFNFMRHLSDLIFQNHHHRNRSHPKDYLSCRLIYFIFLVKTCLMFLIYLIRSSNQVNFVILQVSSEVMLNPQFQTFLTSLQQLQLQLDQKNFSSQSPVELPQYLRT